MTDEKFYTGKLNEERVAYYKRVANQYNIKEGAVRDIFSMGIAFACNDSEEPKPPFTDVELGILHEIATTAYYDAMEQAELMDKAPNAMQHYLNRGRVLGEIRGKIRKLQGK